MTLRQEAMVYAPGTPWSGNSRSVSPRFRSSPWRTRDPKSLNWLRCPHGLIRQYVLQTSIGLTHAVVDAPYKSASLHDIVRVAIPDHILHKPGRLIVEEFEVMKTHADHGRAAIETAEAALEDESSFLRHARDIAWCHHERWDGTGYPRGLAGRDIPLSTRLMAVADVYDALISRRVYKPPMSHDAAVDIIRRECGKPFDPDVVAAFLAVEGCFRQIAERFADQPKPTIAAT